MMGICRHYTHLQMAIQFLPPMAMTAPPLYAKID